MTTMASSPGNPHRGSIVRVLNPSEADSVRHSLNGAEFSSTIDDDTHIQLNADLPRGMSLKLTPLEDSLTSYTLLLRISAGREQVDLSNLGIKVQMVEGGGQTTIESTLETDSHQSFTGLNFGERYRFYFDEGASVAAPVEENPLRHLYASAGNN